MCEENSINKLFYENINLVKCLVNKLEKCFYDKDDLYQVGLMGLYNAAIKYDKNKNVKFSTYAIYYILGEIKRELRENKLIKYNKKIYKVKKLLQEGKKTEEIVQLLNVSSLFVLDVYTKNFDLSKIDEFDYEIIKDNSKNINVFMIAKECLDLKLYTIIINKYIYKLSQKSIANIIGVNQATVSRLEKKALRILRENVVNYK